MLNKSSLGLHLPKSPKKHGFQRPLGDFMFLLNGGRPSLLSDENREMTGKL
jgi:hypothetical protein